MPDTTRRNSTVPNGADPMAVQSPLRWAWSTPAGAAAQGAFIDPALGAGQLGAHVLGAFGRATGLPGLDYSSSADKFVNDYNSALDANLRAYGRNPAIYEAARIAGAVASPVELLGPEAEGALLAQRAGALRAAGGAGLKAGLNAVAFSPEDTRHGESYWVRKGEDVAASGILGLGQPSAEKALGRGLGKLSTFINGADTQLGKVAGHPIGENVPGRAGIDAPAPQPIGEAVPGRAGIDGTGAEDGASGVNDWIARKVADAGHDELTGQARDYLKSLSASSGVTPDGTGSSLSDHFGVFGNRRLRPEIFGDDPGFTFPVAPGGAMGIDPGFAFSGGSSANIDPGFDAPYSSGVNLATPDYLQPGFSGGPVPGSRVNLDPGSFHPFDPDLWPVS